MKKIIISAFALVLGFVLSASVASAQAFNTSAPIPTLTITNTSTNPCVGPVASGCWTTSTQAMPGDVIAVQVYYDNDTNITAQGTTLSIQPRNSSGQVSSMTFVGGVASTTIERAVGNASVQLSSPSSITYISGSARWYPSNGASSSVNENGLFGSTGFNIGSVSAGQGGTLVANFQISQQIQTPQCSDNIDNDNDGRIDFSGGDQSCTSSSDTTENTVDVPPTCSAVLNSNVNTVTSGNPVVLNWSTTNLSSITIYPNIGTVNQSGNATDYPTASTTYTLTGYGCGTTTTRTVLVNVTQQYQCSDNIDNDNDGRIDFSGGDQSCTSTTDNTENTYDLSPQCSDGYDNDGDGYVDYPNDPACYSSTDNTESPYNIPVYQCNDGIDNDNDGLVDLFDPGCYSSTDTSEANSSYQCNDGVDNDGDSYIDYPNDPACYSSTDNTESPYNNPNPVYQCNDGIDNDNDGRVDYAGGDQSCTSSTDTTENTYDNSTTCDANFYSSTNSSYITSGTAVTLSWNTVGLSSLTIYPNVGTVNSSGSTIVYPTANTTYTLSGNGCSNTYSRTVNIYVNSINPPSSARAITTVATILSTTQARLNGIAVPNNSNNTATVWFEWGTTGYLGNRTNTQTAGSYTNTNNSYSDVVGNLVPGTWYYYRAVVQDSYGVSYGDIIRFNTQPTTTTKTPTTVVSTTSKSQASLLELRIENSFERACIENIVDYTITYKNISKQTLKDTVLTFINPKEITYISSSKGKYQVIDRTLTIDVGNIAPGATGSIIVHGRINSDAREGNLLVSTSTVVYTNSVTKAQEDAIAYSLITMNDNNDCPNSANLLGGDTSGFWSFLPNTLVEWLLLILVILGLIVLGRNLYSKKA